MHSSACAIALINRMGNSLACLLPGAVIIGDVAGGADGSLSTAACARKDRRFLGGS